MDNAGQQLLFKGFVPSEDSAKTLAAHLKLLCLQFENNQHCPVFFLPVQESTAMLELKRLKFRNVKPFQLSPLKGQANPFLFVKSYKDKEYKK